MNYLTPRRILEMDSQGIEAGWYAANQRTRAMALNLQRAASELAEKIAALPAGHPYAGAVEKNVYLFTPTEAERDLIVQALCAFAAASPANGSS